MSQKLILYRHVVRSHKGMAVLVLTSHFLAAGCSGGNQLISASDGPNTVSTAGSVPTTGGSISTTGYTHSFASGQSASVVIGQTDFTSNATGTTASTFSNYLGSFDVSEKKIAISDYTRVLIYNSIPSVNGASADIVIGQPNMTSSVATCSAAGFGFVEDVRFTPSGGLLVSEALSSWTAPIYGNRSLIFNTIPTTNGVPADLVIGQPDLSTCSTSTTASRIRGLGDAIITPSGKVLLADFSAARVLIFNSTPNSNGASANLVLGQSDFTSFAAATPPSSSSMTNPFAIWSDDTKVVVGDYANNRLQIWNTFPTSNNQAADLVLGQPNMTSNTANNGGISARTLNQPNEIWSNGTMLMVSDSANNRILIWNTFPTSNFQPADVVIGQPDFATSSAGLSAEKFNGPGGVAYANNQIFVNDSNNNRVLIFNAN